MYQNRGRFDLLIISLNLVGWLLPRGSALFDMKHKPAPKTTDAALFRDAPLSARLLQAKARKELRNKARKAYKAANL